MTQAVQQLLDSFDRLPEPDRLIAVSEILKRAGDMNYPTSNDELTNPYREDLNPSWDRSTTPLSEEDEELVRLAELTFMELDAREAADGNS